MMDPGLKDKVVLITGANNPYGIGAATARDFAAQGARVFTHFFRLLKIPGEVESAHSPEPVSYQIQKSKTADEVTDAIRQRGGRAEVWEANLSNPANIPPLFDQVERVFGPVDILVNNAAAREGDTFVPSGVGTGLNRLSRPSPRRAMTTTFR